MLRITARLLAQRWNVDARHVLYHKDGTWYNNLERFPGALFDANGYVVFPSEADYLACPQLSIGKETNVRPHISAIRGYRRILE
jgi:5-methylcytosine-specific restriction protein A